MGARLGAPAVASIGSYADVDYSQVLTINLGPPLLREKPMFFSVQVLQRLWHTQVEKIMFERQNLATKPFESSPICFTTDPYQPSKLVTEINGPLCCIKARFSAASESK